MYLLGDLMDTKLSAADLRPATAGTVAANRDNNNNNDNDNDNNNNVNNNINMIDNSNNNEQLLMKAHTAGTVAASGGEGLITRQRLIAIVIVIVIVTVIVLVLVLVLVLVIVNTPPPMNVYSV